MFRGDFRGASGPREWRQRGRAARDAGRETVFWWGRDSERPIKFSSASGMTNECFSKGAKGKVSHTWLCGPRAGFGSCAGTAGLRSSVWFGDRRLGGSCGRPSEPVFLIMITPEVTSIMMGSRKAKIKSIKY